jgi:hypothetical protein
MHRLTEQATLSTGALNAYPDGGKNRTGGINKKTALSKKLITKPL